MAILNNIELRQSKRRSVRKRIEEHAERVPDPTCSESVSKYLKKMKDLCNREYLEACDLVDYDVQVLLATSRKLQPDMRKLDETMHEVSKDIVLPERFQYVEDDEEEEESEGKQRTIFDAMEENESDNDSNGETEATDSEGAGDNAEPVNGSAGEDAANGSTGKGKGGRRGRGSRKAAAQKDAAADNTVGNATPA